jgi:hypothetical protein
MVLKILQKEYQQNLKKFCINKKKGGKYLPPFFILQSIFI